MTYQQPQQPGPPYQPPPQPGYQQQGYPPPGHPQQQGGYPQQGYPVQPQQVVTKIGLSTTVHLLYFFLGWIPCFLGWVAWAIHATMARKTIKTTIG